MSLPATDSFTGTNGDPLSANWTTDDGAFAIYSNSIRSTDSDVSSAWWDADSFNNDQFFQADVAAAAAWKAVGLVVRRSAANSLYFFEAHTEAFSMQKLVSGSWTEIASGGSIATSDVIRYEASGTTITPKKNGSTTGTPGAQTDTSLSSGSAGIWFYAASGTDTRLDNWEGGNISSGISGSLSKTLDGLTKTIDGDVAVDGDLAKTLDGLTKTIDGDVAVDGDLAKTLDDLSKALAGAVDVVGALDKTLDGYTLSAAGTVTSGISGSLDKTLDDLTRSLAGTVDVAGALSATLGGVTLASAGTTETTGTLSATLGNISYTLAAAVSVVGALDKTLDGLAISAAGVVGDIEYFGTLDQTLAGVGFSSAGSVALVGAASVTLGDVSCASAGVLMTGVLGHQVIQDSLIVKALATNTGLVWIGKHSDDTVSGLTGFELAAGQELTFEWVDNLADIYVNQQVDTDELCWIRTFV